MGSLIANRGRRFGGGLLAVSALAIVLAVAGAPGWARAQTTAPTPEQQAATCKGELTIQPDTIYFGQVPEVEILASGLDASAPYVITLDGTQIGSGTTTPSGTASYVAVLQPQAASLGTMIVQSVTSCAASTLKIVGPSRARCVPQEVNGMTICMVPAGPPQ